MTSIAKNSTEVLGIAFPGKSVAESANFHQSSPGRLPMATAGCTAALTSLAWIQHHRTRNISSSWTKNSKLPIRRLPCTRHSHCTQEFASLRRFRDNLSRRTSGRRRTVVAALAAVHRLLHTISNSCRRFANRRIAAKFHRLGSKHFGCTSKRAFLRRLRDKRSLRTFGRHTVSRAPSSVARRDRRMLSSGRQRATN